MKLTKNCNQDWEKLFQTLDIHLCSFYFNWNSLQAQLNSHFEPWSHKKKKKNEEHLRKFIRKNPKIKDAH